jgi:hypothetical protein
MRQRHTRPVVPAQVIPLGALRSIYIMDGQVRVSDCADVSVQRVRHVC